LTNIAIDMTKNAIRVFTGDHREKGDRQSL
jgi:hypothetical protein